MLIYLVRMFTDNSPDGLGLLTLRTYLLTVLLTLPCLVCTVVKLQKIARILSLSKYNAHTEPIFKMLKLHS